MTANLVEDGTEPNPEFLPDAVRNFEHGGVSVAGSGLQGEGKDFKDGNQAGGDSGRRIPERDTSAEVQYHQASTGLARQNLRVSRPRRRKLDIQLQFSDQDEDRGGEMEEDLAEIDVATAEVGPAPQEAASEGWESCLPQRHLRVLLVEDDDSTRHVVAALLRNCSYEVTSAGNGLQALELLEGPNSHFDLVLTDVVMPCLSGVGLLSRIMSREAGKQIPVVMMSSHDSMDIVFKCLSKGAADYLVKPVRKNELKNLWQHVWRKCHSSSGSGSGSGSQTGKLVRSKRRAGSGNNSGSNDGSDDGSSGLNLRGGSDNGSGTQSSWTKRAVEVESPQLAGGREISGPSSGILPKSEFAPLQTRVEEIKGLRPGKMKEGHIASQNKAPEADVQHDMEPAAERSPAAELEDVLIAKAAFNKSDTGKTVLDLEAMETCEKRLDNTKNGSLSLSNPSDEYLPEAMDLTAAITSQLQGGVGNPGDSGVGEESMDGGALHISVTKNNTDSSSLPTLELSLKRSRNAGDDDADADGRRILRQSGGSAFSRYSTTVANMSHQFIPGSCLLHGYPLSTGFGGHSLSPGGPGGSNAGLLHRGPSDRPGSSRGSGDVSTPLLVHPSLSNNGNGNGQDMSSSVVGPSGRDVFAGPGPVKDEAVSLAPMSGQQMSRSVPLPSSGMLSYDGMSTTFGAPMHQVYYSHTGPSPWTTGAAQLADREVFENTFHDHGQLSHPQAQRHPHHQSLHRHHDHQQQHNHRHHHHATLPQHPAVQQEDSVIACAAASIGARCGSSNMAGNMHDGCNGQSGSSNCHGSNNNGHGNGSVNGSASGSNNCGKGNNGHSNGQSVAHAAVAGNGDSGNGSGHGDCGMNNTNHGTSGNASGICNAGNGIAFATGPEATKFSRREAALNKFRQKRKERCFEKKVRYQSRKRLAEQRPRVRGQFVRQAIYEGGAGEQDQ